MTAATRATRKRKLVRSDRQLRQVLTRIEAEARNTESYPYWLPANDSHQRTICPDSNASPYPRLNRLIDRGWLKRTARGVYLIQPPGD